MTRFTVPEAVFCFFLPGILAGVAIAVLLRV